MIGMLQGRIHAKHPPRLVLDVQGVGYELEAPMSTFYELPDTGSEVLLHTHLAVREDALALYGFASESERRLFRELIRVSGVGAKMALAILSGISVDGFVRSVRDGETGALVRLPGIGKKTAERLVIEMRDRLQQGAEAPGAAVTGGSATGHNALDEAYSALLALGYKPAEASRLVKAVGTSGRESEEIIRLALRSTLGGGGG
ncbi:MAG TPA: Holliday junction branch migration protein RuvA [Gammaproteobacteria bacterium]|nr:Holliday junction branch migration protein RuvA [Gammaproteobacteria bacterium]